MLEGLGQALIAFTLGHRRRFLTSHPGRLGLPFSEVDFLSRDGWPISGWILSHSRPRGVVVLCHGIFSNRVAMLEKACWLWRQGYSALLFDFRARGRSGGNRCSLGVEEPFDLLGALDFLDGFPELSQVPRLAVGESLGAAVVVSVMARDERLQGACLEACFASMEQAIRRRCEVLAGPWVERLHTWACGQLRERWGIEFSQVHPERDIARVDRPLALIHDAWDWSLPPSIMERLCCCAPKAVSWTAPGSFHCRAWHMAGQGYRDLVGAFLRSLTGDSQGSQSR